MVDNSGQPLDDEGGDAVGRVRMVEIADQYATHDTSYNFACPQISTDEPWFTRFRS